MGKIMLNEISYSGGGGGNADIVRLTQAEYDALPSSKLTDDKVYMITDANGDGSQFQPIIYSENEREIGVWVDGKPLYEKTNIITNVTDKGWTQIFSDSNANVLSYTGYCLSNTGEKSPLDRYVDNNTQVRTLIYDNGTKVQTEYYNQFNTLASIVATIQYTKTTDVSGSGTWTPQGVPAVHYSTNEQVVGTWIDGNTIYKKTFYNAGGVAQSLNIAHGINNLDKCIKYEGTAYDSNDSSRVYVLPRIDYGSVDIGIDHIDSTNIVVGINNNFQTRIIDIYITIYYTKTQGGA